MSNENIDNQTDEVEDSLTSGLKEGSKAVGGMAKDAAKKAAVEALKKKIGVTAISALKSSLIMLVTSISLPVILALIVVIVIFGVSVQNKEYSHLAEENTIEGDSYEIYEGKESGGNDSGIEMYGSESNSSKYNVSKNTSSRVVLSESNQAIENYHYYNSSKSVLDNKIYIPLKNINIEKKADEMYNQLVKKGVIEEDGNERFISEDSLTDVQKSWEMQYGKSGGSFSWTNEKLKKKLDKKINTGITVKGFKDENIGNLKKIEDEDKKLEIKDEYNREVYFQLPEELLGSLNKNLYEGDFIYDEPFVQGVKYTYKKVDKEAEKKNESEKQSKETVVNKKSADNSRYTAELFDKEFAKQNGVLKGTGQKFIDYANKYDIDAALAVAIAVEESGRGTSSLARKNYNFFGMRAVSGGWRKFNSVEEGIEGGISYISRKYISQGITNLQDIGKIYCVPPEGWIKNVSAHYKTITGREYEGSMAGQGYGSNLTEFRGVPEYEIKLDSYGIGKNGNSQKYGLGTVFLYKPTVEVKVKRGYTLEQTVTSSYGEKKQIGQDEIVDYTGKKNPNQSQTVVGEDGKKVNKIIEYEVKEVDDGNGGKKKVQIKRIYEQEIIYTPNAVATPVEEVDAKITYVLDKAITFAGVYEFEYGLEVEDVGGDTSSSERKIEGATDSAGNELVELSKSETRTIKIYEKPINVKNKYLNTKYMDEYLANFKAEVPKNIMKKFDINKLVNAFKGEKKVVTGNSTTGGNNGVSGSDVANTEQWRELAIKYGQQYGIDPALILSQIYNESKGNVHATEDGSSSYRGLSQMGGPPKKDSEHDVYHYFDKATAGLHADVSKDSRLPHCPASGHDEAEHQRVAEFHIEYVAKRVSASIGYAIYKYTGKDFRKTEVSAEDIKYAIFWAFGSFNTGEGGQNQLVTKAGGDLAHLYSNEGKVYTKYHNSTTLKSTATYIEKLYNDYPLFSEGLSILDSVNTGTFDQSKWFTHPNMGKVDKDKTSASSSIMTGTNGAGMDIEKIKEYKEFEKTGGSLTGKFMTGTVTQQISYEDSDLIRKSTIGMIEGKAAYDVQTSKGVFWGQGYVGEYFDSGLPAKPLYGDELSDTIWNGKIRESSRYTGDKDSIISLSKMYGTEVYNIIKRAVAQEGKEFENGGDGPYSFDHSGLLWYVYNYNSKVKYFDKDTIGGYYKKITTEVPADDIRPGDIIFYTGDKGSDVPDKIGIYLGQKAYLYIDEKDGVVSIGAYEDLKSNQECKIIAERRLLKYSSTTGEGSLDSGMVGQLPADLLKGDWAHPLGAASYRKTSPLGYRTHPITGQKGSYHTGVDWALATGNGVYATKAGTVIISKFQPLNASGRSAGEYIVIKHDDGYTTMYAHLSKRGVKVGDKVEKGQLIGLVGTTGGSTGPHLHFEIVKGVPGHFGGTKGEYPNGNYIDANKIFG